MAAAGALGLTVAMVGTYWDDAWHTDRGRDEFAIPPHLMLYAGVAIALCAVGAWALAALRSGGWGVLWASPGLRLALIGAAATVVSAPVDEWWHQSFGRDSVLWSPPHLVGVAGTLALATGLLAGVALATDRLGRAMRVVLAAAVIATLQVPVLEYDSDVPQFPTFWYLPVSIGGACLSFWLVARLVDEPWMTTRAAATCTLLRLGVIAFLALVGFSSTTVPPLIVGAALFDVTPRSTSSHRLWLAALGLLGGWWVAIELQPSTATSVEASHVAVTGAVALVGLASVVVRGRRVPTLGAAAAAVVIGVSTLAQTPTWAHDPGQGQVSGQVEMTVQRRGERAQITATAYQSCDELVGRRLVARRAGATTRASLGSRSTARGCEWSGELGDLREGAWFVYLELENRGKPLEAWVHVPDGGAVHQRRDLYAPPIKPDRRGQVLAGAALIAAVAGLVAATIRLASKAGAAST